MHVLPDQPFELGDVLGDFHGALDLPVLHNRKGMIDRRDFLAFVIEIALLHIFNRFAFLKGLNERAVLLIGKHKYISQIFMQDVPFIHIFNLHHFLIVNDGAALFVYHMQPDINLFQNAL